MTDIELPHTILADIPYEKWGSWDRPSPSDHYSVMPLSLLKNYNFPHDHDSCLLLFWGWNCCMPECLDIVKAWGFTYRTMITWIKPKMGLGNYVRNATEHILLATKGKYEKQERAKSFTS